MFNFTPFQQELSAWSDNLGGHKSYLLLVVAIASPNGLTWYLSSDQYEEEESVVVHDRRMPLYLNSHRIVEVEETISVSIWQH